MLIWCLFISITDGRSKGVVNAPKKRGRKPKLDLMDDDALVKGDLDSDHFVYTDKDIQEELGRTDAYQDFKKIVHDILILFNINLIFIIVCLLLNGKR